MDFLILNTKIQPEGLQPKIIGRPALENLLKSNSDKNLICLIAGAGYGKTTIVKEFLNTSDLNYSWYKIDDSDDNFFLFFAYIVHSVRLNNKLFGKSSLEIINSLKSRANLKSDLNSVINTVIVTFLNEFKNKIQKDFYIVLDDFHLLQRNEWVSKSMLYLLENAPVNLHIIITSREKLSFELSALKAKRKYFEMGSEDLRFSEREIKLLTAEIYNRKFNDNEINILYNKFEGWVTGLHLFLQADEISGLEKISSKLPQYLYDFFAGEIFSSKREQIKDFLLGTCMLDNFSADTCNSILDIKESPDILNELLNGNIFIKKQEVQINKETVDSYSYQDLFRDFLVAKFNETKTENEKREYYKNIAGYFILRGDEINAIKFLLFAEDYNMGVKFILSSISTVIDSGNLNLVDNWLKSLPEEIKQKNPFILYYLGCISKYYYGNIEESLAFFEKALCFLKPSDKTFFIKTNIHISEILIDLGRIEQSKKKLTELLKKKLDNKSKAQFLYWLSLCYYSESDYINSLKMLHESLDIAINENLKKLVYEISNQLGNIYLIKGDFVKSLYYYENVINHIKNIYNKFQTLTNIVQLYSHSGQYEKAKKSLDEALEMQLTFPSPFFRLNYLLAGTHLYYMIGDYEQTIRLWNEILTLAQKSNLPYYKYLSYVSLGYCFFYLKKFSKTAQYYEMAEEFIGELSETEKVDFNFCKALLKKETGFSPDIEKELEIAYHYFDSNDMLYNKVQAGFNLADFYIRKKNYKNGKKYLEECLQIISDNEYISLIQAELFVKRYVFDFAVENKIKMDFISGIFSSVVSLMNFDWISEECRERMESDIENLYDIRLECFGGIKIKVRGEVIDDDKWIRKTRKLIFSYIMLNHKKNLTKENIVDLFYPDSTPENADNTFYQTISNIRSIFKSTLNEKKSDNANQYISYSDRIIQLNPNYFYFIDTFEFEKLYKKAMGYGVSEKNKIKYIERAVKLYKGEFLEGYYQGWCEHDREKYADMHIKMLNEILKIYKENKDYENIKYYSEKLLLSDNLNEDAYFNIIKAEIKTDNILAAKKKYKLMLKTFKSEIIDSPSGETIRKINSLLEV